MKELYFNPSSMVREELEDGVVRYIRTGTNLQIVEYRFPSNTAFPAHSHDIHEQMGYLVSGKMGFKIGDETRILVPGDYYRAPIGVVHQAWTLDEEAVLIDIFSPVREDLAAVVDHPAEQ